MVLTVWLCYDTFLNTVIPSFFKRPCHDAKGHPQKGKAIFFIGLFVSFKLLTPN